jgi:hypothetical protein
MAAPVNPVVVDELVIGTPGPVSRSLVVLVGEDGDGCGGGNVRGVVEAEMGFPIESAGGNARVGQPRGVVLSRMSVSVKSPAECPLTVRPNTAEVKHAGIGMLYVPHDLN